MTQTPYRPATPSQAVTALKLIAAVGLVLSGLVAAGIAAIVAIVVYTGCLIGCSDPQPLEGMLLGALAAGLLVAGPALARLMWRRTTTVRGAAIWAGLVVVGPGGYLLVHVVPLLTPQF